MSANYIIREAIDSDFTQILEIWKYYWNDTFKSKGNEYQKVIEKMRDAFDDRKDCFSFWVVDNNDGEIYGWISCIPALMSPLRNGFNGELSIYLRHDKINQTIGFKLISEVIKILEKSSLFMLWAHICPKNTVSQKMASKVGFRNTEILIINSPFYPIINLWIKTLKEAI